MIDTSGSGAMSRPLLVRNVRVFDGVTTLENASVRVRNGVFDAIDDDPKAPGDAEVIDGAGKTLLPGLFDAHIHAAGQFRVVLRYAASMGVTTVLDMGGAGRRLEQMKLSAAQDPNMADIFGASQPAVARDALLRRVPGLENIPTIDESQEAVSWVDERIAEGSGFLKIVFDSPEGGSLNEDTLAAIVRAAHSRGKQVWVHALQERKARTAVKTGADGLAHLFVGDTARSDFGLFVQEHHVAVVPTLVALLNTKVGEPQVEPMLTDYRLRPFINVQQLHLWPAKPALNHLREGLSEAMKLILMAGVPILAGTDAAPFPVGLPWGASLHRELELLVQEGLTPAQALVTATSAPARAFRFSDRGYIRPGMRADMLLVRGDPTSDIKSTRNIEAVWKSGLKVNRAGTYLDSD